MKAQLKITVSEWSEWLNKQPETKEYSLELEVGDSVDTEWLGEVGNPTIELTEIDSDQITLKTNSLAPTTDGQIDFKANTIDLESKINKRTSLKLSTPTVDLGTKVEISLLNVTNE